MQTNKDRRKRFELTMGLWEINAAILNSQTRAPQKIRKRQRIVIFHAVSHHENLIASYRESTY